MSHYVIYFSHVHPGPAPGTSGQQYRHHQQHQQGGYPGQQAHLGYPGQHKEYRKSLASIVSLCYLTLVFIDDPPPPPPTHVQNYGPEGTNNHFQYSQCTGKKKALCVRIFPVLERRLLIQTFF